MERRETLNWDLGSRVTINEEVTSGKWHGTDTSISQQRSLRVQGYFSGLSERVGEGCCCGKQNLTTPSEHWFRWFLFKMAVQFF